VDFLVGAHESAHSRDARTFGRAAECARDALSIAALAVAGKAAAGAFVGLIVEDAGGAFDALGVVVARCAEVASRCAGLGVKVAVEPLCTDLRVVARTVLA
jgi:hypothetical protein